jgi:hypothetical protein
LSSRLLTRNVRAKIYKTIILTVLMYVCEIWSFTLSDGVENRFLRRIFGPKRDEVTGDWRKFQSEELHN